MTSPAPKPHGYRCIDCDDPTWDTSKFLCRWCERWRLIDLRAARVS